MYQQQIVERDGQVRQLESKNSAACQETEDLREKMATLSADHERELEALNTKIRELQTVADPRLLEQLETLREKRVASERAHAEERATLAAKIDHIEARSLHEAEVIDQLREDLENSRTQLAERVKELVHSRAVSVQKAELARVNAELASLYEQETARRARLEKLRAQDDHDTNSGKLECALVQRNTLANIGRSLVDQVVATMEYARHLETHIEKAGRKLQKQKQTRSKILEGLADSEALTTDYEKKWKHAEKEVARLKGILKAAKNRRSRRRESSSDAPVEQEVEEEAVVADAQSTEGSEKPKEVLSPIVEPRAERLSAVAEEEEEEDEEEGNRTEARPAEQPAATNEASEEGGKDDGAEESGGSDSSDAEREVLGKRKSIDPSQLAEIDDLLGDTDDSDDADESFDLGAGIPTLNESGRKKRRN